MKKQDKWLALNDFVHSVLNRLSAKDYDGEGRIDDITKEMQKHHPEVTRELVHAMATLTRFDDMCFTNSQREFFSTEEFREGFKNEYGRYPEQEELM